MPSTDGKPRLRRWIAASPAIYLIHDLEELVTVRGWLFLAGLLLQIPVIAIDLLMPRF